MTQNPLVDIDGETIDHEFEVLLTPAETARLLAVSPRTVTKWAKEGKLRCTWTSGGHRRFPADAVRAASRGEWQKAADTNRTAADMSPADVFVATEG